MSKGAQIAIAVLSVFAGIAWIITSSGTGEGTFQYYADLSEFVAKVEPVSAEATHSFRVHGFVLEGSIQKDLPAGHVDFVIRDQAGATRYPVRLIGIEVPDLFKDGAEIVIEGQPEGSRFVASRVMAKCPSKYEASPETEA